MNKIKYLSLALSIMLMAMVGAQPNFIDATVVPSGNQIFIPEMAFEVTPGVFSLGTALDVDGRKVEGFLITKDARPPFEENAKPSWAGKKGNSCFETLSKGARWKTTEAYVTTSEIDSTLTATSLNTWDSEVAFDVFGTEDTSLSVDGVDTTSPDGKNEIMFENLGSTSTVAFTVIWGIFSGPPSQREIVEWDGVFNSAYDWSTTGEAGKMDYLNVATHEFGHALGLGHPTEGCTEETMYRFVSLGETKKQDLNSGDINGINKIYS